MIKIGITFCATGISTLAEFPSEDVAMQVMESHSDIWDYWEDENNLVPDYCTRVISYLNPQCEHGLSAWLCYGPEHYATDREIAMGY